MFLKSIKVKLKERAAKLALGTYLTRNTRQSNTEQSLKTVGCIVNLDEFPEVERLKELQSLLDLRPGGLKIIGFSAQEDAHNLYGQAFFTRENLAWKGVIDNGDVREFLAMKYDLLVNFYSADELLLKLLTVQVTSNFNVGFSELDVRLNDLIFQLKLGNFESFKKELVKYLKVLNKIK